jgi:hypothetical protein
MIHFVRKLRELVPKMIINQPTSGFPQVSNISKNHDISVVSINDFLGDFSEGLGWREPSVR